MDLNGTQWNSMDLSEPQWLYKIYPLNFFNLNLVFLIILG